MFEEEIWKPIPGFYGYEVSSKGRVKSFKHFLRLNKYSLRKLTDNCPRERILKQALTEKNNYKRYAITLNNNGKYYRFNVHRLVLIAFVGNPPEGYIGCHNDGDSLNNNLSNLRWDTHKNNTLDSKIHGTWFKPPECKEKGIERYNAIFKEEDIIAMRKIPKYRGLVRDLAKKFNCSVSVISNILKRRAWKHL